MTQKKVLLKFVNNAAYFMLQFKKDGKDGDFGKILTDLEIKDVDLSKNEFHRSVDYDNGDALFVLDLKPAASMYVDNPIKLLINNVNDARLIETIYPGKFCWVFDGISVKGYARVPSGCVKQNTTISRYGGTEMFIKILNHHLKNIVLMGKGRGPNYNFVESDVIIPKTEISIGSINLFNLMYSVPIDITSSYSTILMNSKENKQSDFEIGILNMKYWAREVNPDLLSDAKPLKLTTTYTTTIGFENYPPCLQTLMNLKHKGNYNRYLIAKFLLSVHNTKDAKFVYYSVLSDKEREHVKSGNCASQFTYVKNNMKRYGCPSCTEMKRFCQGGCPFAHPIEPFQKLEEKKK